MTYFIYFSYLLYNRKRFLLIQYETRFLSKLLMFYFLMWSDVWKPVIKETDYSKQSFVYIVHINK